MESNLTGSLQNWVGLLDTSGGQLGDYWARGSANLTGILDPYGFGEIFAPNGPNNLEMELGAYTPEMMPI